MTLPSKHIVEAAVAHAKESAALIPPRESCGVVVKVGKVGRYWPCRNIGGGEDFTIDPRDLQAARAAGEVIMVVHSHIRTGPQPTLADIDGCEKGTVPWLIVTPSGATHLFKPCGVKIPVKGRPYLYGVHDCATLVRDWYALHMGVTSIDIMPTENEWWLKGQDLLTEHIAAQGFVEVSKNDLQAGDVLLIRIVSDVAHHCAIWLGNGRILHHPRNQLSCESVFGDYWRDRVYSAWRHTCAK